MSQLRRQAQSTAPWLAVALAAISGVVAVLSSRNSGDANETSQRTAERLAVLETQVTQRLTVDTRLDRMDDRIRENALLLAKHSAQIDGLDP